MKTNLLRNCAKGNLHLPNSLAGAFLTFRKLAIIAWLQLIDKTTTPKKEICKTYAFHENSTPLLVKQSC